MKYIRDPEKDAYVRSRKGGGGFGFQDVVDILEGEGIRLDVYNDKASYSGQYMFIIFINDYPYKVPYKRLENGVAYLITMYPCSDFKEYL